MHSSAIIITATFAVAIAEQMTTLMDHKVDSNFRVTGIPSPLSSIELIFQIKPNNYDELDYISLVGSSLPSNSNMGTMNYLAQPFVSAMTLNPEGKRTVLSFLSSLGEEIVTMNVQDYLVSAYGPNNRLQLLL